MPIWNTDIISSGTIDAIDGNEQHYVTQGTLLASTSNVFVVNANANGANITNAGELANFGTGGNSTSSTIFIADAFDIGITNLATGSITSVDGFAIQFFGPAGDFQNAGMVSGGSGAVLMQSDANYDASVTNSGTIMSSNTSSFAAVGFVGSGILFNSSTSSFTNTGLVDAGPLGNAVDFDLSGFASGFLANSGTIIGSVTGSGTALDIANTGIMEGRVTATAATLRIENSGTMNGTIRVTDNGYDIRNTGLITNTINADDDSWTDRLVNDGDILSNSFIDMSEGSDILRNSGTIQLQASLFMGDPDAAVDDDLLENTGEITADIEFGAGADRLVNHGTMFGDIAAAGALELENYGSITGEFFGNTPSGVTASYDVLNAGSFSGVMFLFGTDDVFRNTGMFTGTLQLFAAQYSFINDGDFAAELQLSGGIADITNTGDMLGDTLSYGGSTVFLGQVNETFNSGSMRFDAISLAGGTHEFVNTGEMLFETLTMGGTFSTFQSSGETTGDILGLVSSDTVELTGTHIGNVRLDAGSDVVVNGGTLQGDINFDSDNATLTNSGDIYGVVFMQTTSTNVFNGNAIVNNFGSVYGTLNLTAADKGLVTNYGLVDGNILLGGAVGYTAGEDGIVTGNISGGSGGAVISGSRFADRAFGNAGDDRLEGKGGNDELNGGADNDVIVGGAGFDLLTGGTGADVFVFDQAVDGDTITDFNSGEDLLDISQLMRMADSLTLVQEAVGPKGGDIITDVTTGVTNGASSRLIVTAAEQGGDTLLTITNLAPVIGSALADLQLQVLLEGVDINLLTVDDFILS